MLRLKAVARRHSVGCGLILAFVTLRGDLKVSVGQSPTNTPAAQSFSVSTVRVNKKNDGRWRLMFTRDGYTATGVTVEQLIRDAYGVYDKDRITGLSGWTGWERFDLEAKVDPDEAAAFQRMDQDQQRYLLQKLLAQRFGLVATVEKPVVAQYVLTITKSGVRFPQAVPFKDAVGTPTSRAHWSRLKPGQLTAEGASMAEFAKTLGLELGRPVADATGLHGRYNLNLEWQPDRDDSAIPSGGTGVTGPDRSGASIFSALKEQLGLELKSQRAPVDVLVVKSVHEPSEN